MVECQLPKLDVVGSTPIARSGGYVHNLDFEPIFIVGGTRSRVPLMNGQTGRSAAHGNVVGSIPIARYLRFCDATNPKPILVLSDVIFS